MSDNPIAAYIEDILSKPGVPDEVVIVETTVLTSDLIARRVVIRDGARLYLNGFRLVGKVDGLERVTNEEPPKKKGVAVQ